MARQKRVQCFSHGPISAGAHYETYWEDVYLRWKGKPGRTVYRAAPCIQSRLDLVSELDIDQRIAKEHPEFDMTEELAYGIAMLDAVDRDGMAVDDYECPNVYTRADVIARAEAERMLTYFLWVQHGISNPKFVWMRPTVVVTPFSFALRPTYPLPPDQEPEVIERKAVQ